MRIVILTNADIGLYRFRRELLVELCQKAEVYIVLPSGEYIDELKGIGCLFKQIEFNRRGINPLADAKLMNQYIRLIKSLSPDIVLTYTIKPNIYGGLACRFLKIPYISNITGLGTAIENGGMLSFISTRLYKLALKRAHCVFFQNSSNMEFFVNRKIVRGKSRLLPGSGVNLKTHCLERYPSENNGIRFLFVGRIMKDKGIEELLYAINTIHSVDSHISADIVGWCDEDYTDDIKRAEKTGSVRYHGFQSDIHTFYSNCHCVVLPSYHEGTSNVLLEASSTGRPVITTRIPGCKETFNEGVSGFGCEAKDGNSLKDAMIMFSSLSEREREEMGIAARRKMEDEFDRNIVIRAYLEEIGQISRQKK